MTTPLKKIAVFPGTFDPITSGHLDVIRRVHKLFDHLIVAIGKNPGKTELFPVDERLALIQGLIADLPNVSVEAYDGLTVELVKRRNAITILRGLRNMIDLESEFQIALTNRAVAAVETVFIMTNERFAFTSSSLIKQIAAMGGDIEQLGALLPESVVKKLQDYKNRKIGPFSTQALDQLKN
jgi:pantetheine-phosphate adenylyltransferase